MRVSFDETATMGSKPAEGTEKFGGGMVGTRC